MTAVDAILIGAGDRGARVYGAWALAHPDQLRIVAVAEPIESRRQTVAREHHIPSKRTFTDWRELLNQPQIARAAIIATQDQHHTGPATAALQAGYDVLLEKPMAHRLEDCMSLVHTAETSGRMLQICHVLRYTDFAQHLYRIIQSGQLGQIITVSHRENVSAWHMAHSYVRGNWRREDQSSPMILAKSCHDFDLLYWLLGRKVTRLSAVGSLLHFCKENAPDGAPQRCTDGCPAADLCPFYAPAFYRDLEPIYVSLRRSRHLQYRIPGWMGSHTPGFLKFASRIVSPLRQLVEYDSWPRSVITDDPTNPEAIMNALKTGPYGRCVYHCDNDVVDHHTVLMEIEGGISVTFTMHGHSFEEARTLRIDGSQATLLAKMGWNEVYIEVRDHRDRPIERIDLPSTPETGGHGGGDGGLMTAFVEVLRDGTHPPLTTARASLESHLLAFAAEDARLSGNVIDIETYREQAQQSG